MNKIYRLIWSEVSRSWIAVAEIFHAVGKQGSTVIGQRQQPRQRAYCAGLPACIRLRALALFILLYCVVRGVNATPGPQEVPTGGQVVGGVASISQPGAGQMAINQSSNSAVINWNTFNVGSQAVVNIYQPSASSALLNRVTSGTPSEIFGQIHANGQVYLSNPDGVFFSRGASVSSGSFVASTMEMDPQQFMQGSRTFNRNGSTASVVNQGNISVADGGFIALLAPEVRNEGMIVANLGTVALASGESVQLQFNQNNQRVNLLVTPSAVKAVVENHYAVIVQGGQIILSARALSQLQGSVVNNDGTLDASSLTSKGGHIMLEGDEITLGNSSQINADGATGGGQVLVGGSWKGEDASIHEASQVIMEQGATIDANATGQGDGGQVVVRSDIHNLHAITLIDGTITALGLGSGSRGGQIETSGYQLGLSGEVNAGRGGEWLLDPIDITVTSSGGSIPIGGGTWSTAGNVLVSSLNSALSNGSDVTLDATGGTGGTGTITISSAISKTAGADVSLTLNAGAGGIAINAAITSTTGNLNLTLNATGSINSNNSGSINTNGGLLTFNNGVTGTISGTISGSGALNKSGSGTLILLGNNTYSGGTTIAGGSTLQMGNGSGIGTINTSSIVINGNLIFNRSNNFSFIATGISGNGSLIQGGSGTLTFINGLFFTGTLVVNSGTLILGTGGPFSVLNVSEVTNNSNIDINTSNTLKYTGVISGTGSLSMIGPGTVILSANQTYSGTTTISAGTIQFGNGGAGGALTSSRIINNSNLIFNSSSSITYSGKITGTGNLTQAGSGTTMLTANETYSGTTTISAGILQLGNGGVSGNLASQRIINNSRLRVNVASTLTYSGAMSGTGTLTQAGSGLLVLAGNNSYSGSTTINANSSMQIGNGGNAGSISSATIIDNGTLAFNRNDTISYSAVISGTGNVAQAGSGTLILAGNESYTGSTTISAGILQLGNGGAGGNLASQVIIDNADLIFNSGSQLTYGGTISGSGNVTQAGSGTVILLANNSYSGTSTINANTTLQIGNNTTSGTLGSGALINNGTWAINRSNAITFANVISGNGALSQLGTGLLTLTGNNTYTGVTTIGSGSTLQLGNGGTSGAIIGASIVDNGTLMVNRSNLLTYSGVISGNGALVQMGSGTLVLTGNETYSGTTTINAGTLQLGNGGSGANLSASSGIVDNSNLIFNASDIILYAGVISGMGNLTQAGSGTTILTANETYSGNTTISAGILQLGNGGAGGNLASQVIVDNADLIFNSGSQLTYGGTISGSGNATQAGSGTVILLANNSYSGTSTIHANTTLQIGNNTSTGTLGAGALINNGTWAINRSNALTFANVISGNGALSQLGAGLLTLTGNNTYTGVTTIGSGSTLQLGNGGTSGAIIGASIVDNGTLMVNRSDLLTYNGVISGTGNLTQAGSGTLVLAGNETYTGTTTISAGELQLGNGGAGGGLVSLSIINNADLIFNSSSQQMVSAIISGTGNVTQAGSNMVILLANNSYSGTTTINSGSTLQIGNNTTSGTLGTGTLVNNGTWAINHSDALILANVISGTGALSQLGSGLLTLTGNNTYTGMTIIGSGSTLQIGNGGNSGAIISASVVDNGTLLFNRSDILTINAVISGGGALTQAGSSTLILTANNTYSGTTTINTGTLQLSDGTAGGGLASLSIVDNSALIFNSSSQQMVSAIISGTGNVTQAGSGIVILLANNSYSGGTTISSGTLELDVGTLGFGSAGTGNVSLSGGTLQFNAGTATANVIFNNNIDITANSTIAKINDDLLLNGDITLSGDLTFNLTGITTVTGMISGSGSVIKSGNGLLAFTNSNSYSGTTTINSGILELDVGTLGSGSVGAGEVILSGGTLQFNAGTATANVIFNNNINVIANSGLNKLSGELLLNGTIAVVTHGDLAFDITGNATVNGIISGSGNISYNNNSPGLLLFLANNTYSGTTTIFQNSTLQIGNCGNSGTLGTGDTNNAGNLTFARGDSYLYQGAITGPGTLYFKPCTTCTPPPIIQSPTAPATSVPGPVLPLPPVVFPTVPGLSYSLLSLQMALYRNAVMDFDTLHHLLAVTKIPVNDQFAIEAARLSKPSHSSATVIRVIPRGQNRDLWQRLLVRLE